MASFSYLCYFKNGASNLKNPFTWTTATVVPCLYKAFSSTPQLSSHPDFLLQSGAWKPALMPITRLLLSDKHSDLLQENKISSMCFTVEVW